MPSASEPRTHFGFREVPESAKAGLVGEVFSAVASRYDLMNDLMSLGAHRLWKRFAVLRSGVRRGHRVLDVAAGSGDLAALFADLVGPAGRVVVTDINPDMLARGKARLLDRGLLGNVEFALADAECLEFEADSFDCVSIAFGLRNVTRMERALAAMRRVLKPGGRALVLEFSKPVSPALARLYELYSFNVIPWLGETVANDRASYQYLVESIRRHPEQAALSAMLRAAGFDEVKVHNLSGGIVALHVGFKY